VCHDYVAAGLGRLHPHASFALANCDRREPLLDRLKAGGTGPNTRRRRMSNHRDRAPSRVTLAEIAAAAGVSVPTVSKVVNGRADVAAETRSRIESLLAQYDYAAPRRTPRAQLIDLVFTELNPWAVEIIRSVQRTALETGCRTAFTVLEEPADVDRWLNTLSETPTDGVILVLTELSPRARAGLAALQVPIVIVDPVGQPDPHIPSIGAANWAGGLMATDHLLDLGHRRIATITGEPSLLCSQARLDGYRAALGRRGVPVDPVLIRNGDFHVETALRLANELLELPDRPTAIFAASDMQAMAVYQAARQHRLRIPDDVSVVGFDDLPMSAWASPPLTTIMQPLSQMATMATRTLLTLVDGTIGEYSNRVELSTSLVVRASTGPWQAEPWQAEPWQAGPWRAEPPAPAQPAAGRRPRRRAVAPACGEAAS
jgi:LacI family transcriptional regulator